jgi:ATP-dependent Clp protease adaptor protein ClpS
MISRPVRATPEAVEGEVFILTLMAVFALGMWEGRRRDLRRYARHDVAGDEISVALHLARHEAKVRQQAHAELTHLCWALLQDESLVERLQSAGVPVEPIEQALEALMDEKPAATRIRAGWYISRAVEDFLLVLQEHTYQIQRPIALQIVLALLLRFVHPSESPLSVQLPDAAPEPIDVDALVFALVHGRKDRPITAPAAAGYRTSGRCEVLLHNDDLTTMDFVQRGLQQFFGQGERDAYWAMLRVHQDGLATLGTFETEVAVERAENMRQAAREAGFPLRLSVLESDPAT